MKAALLVTLLILTACAEDLGVQGITPSLGVTRGGEQVTILGAGFDQQEMFSVYFGSTRAEDVSIVGSDRLIVRTPSHARPSRVDVRVVAGNGQEFIIRNGFEFTLRNEMAECVNIGRVLNGKVSEPRTSARNR